MESIELEYESDGSPLKSDTNFLVLTMAALLDRLVDEYKKSLNR